MAYLESDEGLLVWGTASGAPHDPDWFRNLRAATTAEIEVGNQRRTVTPRELHGARREAAWQSIVARRPGATCYERKAARTIPVALLVG